MGRGVQERKMCPSPGVRDKLTAQLLFQLHGLFENNIMSFITDNPREMAAMATREKNGPDQPIRSSSHAPSLYKLSLLHGGPSPPPLGEEPWKKDGKRGAGRRITRQKGKGPVRKQRPRRRGTPGVGCFSTIPQGQGPCVVHSALPGAQHRPGPEQTLRN